MRYSHDKKNKNLDASQTITTARIAPKICRSQSPTCGSECSRFRINWFTFGGVIAERVNAVLLPRRVFPIFAYGRLIILFVFNEINSSIFTTIKY